MSAAIPGVMRGNSTPLHKRLQFKRLGFDSGICKKLKISGASLLLSRVRRK
jgi:hypothetical protein